MEQWKQSVITGVFLVILALAFSAARGGISIWMIDIAFGLYRKKKEGK